MKFVNPFHNTEIDVEPISVGVTIYDEPCAEFTESQIESISMELCGIKQCTCCKFENHCYDEDGKSYLIMVKTQAMTKNELKAAQLTLGLTNQALADTLKVSLRAVEMWRQGARPIPGPVEVAITLMLNQPR
jgi:DNA-binding transcriptional regulator YiaG